MEIMSLLLLFAAIARERPGRDWEDAREQSKQEREKPQSIQSGRCRALYFLLLVCRNVKLRLDLT